MLILNCDLYWYPAHPKRDLNTLYVDIKLILLQNNLSFFKNLNTLYVDIKPSFLVQFRTMYINLNTLYVDIKRECRY